MQMKRVIMTTTLAIAAVCAAQEPITKGAKALFLDPTSGARVGPSQRRQPAGGHAKAPTEPAQMNAGLMYYIERQRPDGGVDRVNTTTIFHSGEKIRLQLKSNVAGRLVIAQKNTDGTSSVLFPDSRVSNGDDHIRANEFAVLPSWSSWFKFDEHPGEERLLVVLTPEGAAADPTSTSQESTRPWDRTRTDQVSELVRDGAKSLVIEVDESKDAATYLVKRPASPKDRAVATLTAEIVLAHR